MTKLDSSVRKLVLLVLLAFPLAACGGFGECLVPAHTALPGMDDTR